MENLERVIFGKKAVSISGGGFVVLKWGLPYHASRYTLEDGSDLTIFVFGNSDSSCLESAVPTCDIGDSKKDSMWKDVACDFLDQEQLEGLIARYLKENDIHVKASIVDYFSISCIFEGASGVSCGVSLFEKSPIVDSQVLVSHRLLHNYKDQLVQMEVTSTYIEDLSIWEHVSLSAHARVFWEFNSVNQYF